MGNQINQTTKPHQSPTAGVTEMKSAEYWSMVLKVVADKQPNTLGEVREIIRAIQADAIASAQGQATTKIDDQLSDTIWDLWEKIWNEAISPHPLSERDNQKAHDLILEFVMSTQVRAAVLPVVTVAEAAKISDQCWAQDATGKWIVRTGLDTVCMEGFIRENAQRSATPIHHPEAPPCNLLTEKAVADKARNEALKQVRKIVSSHPFLDDSKPECADAQGCLEVIEQQIIDLISKEVKP